VNDTLRRSCARVSRARISAQRQSAPSWPVTLAARHTCVLAGVLNAHAAKGRFARARAPSPEHGLDKHVRSRRLHAEGAVKVQDRPHGSSTRRCGHRHSLAEDRLRPRIRDIIWRFCCFSISWAQPRLGQRSTESTLPEPASHGHSSANGDLWETGFFAGT